jgi:hypothetical protein
MARPVRGFVALSPGGGKKEKYVYITGGDEVRLTYYPTYGGGDEPITVYMRRLPEGVDEDAGKVGVLVRVERRDGCQEVLFEGTIDQPEEVKVRR